MWIVFKIWMAGILASFIQPNPIGHQSIRFSVADTSGYERPPMKVRFWPN
jgi:hypothetical protein